MVQLTVLNLHKRTKLVEENEIDTTKSHGDVNYDSIVVEYCAS